MWLIGNGAGKRCRPVVSGGKYALTPLVARPDMRARGRFAMAVTELTLFGGFGVRAPSEGAVNLLGQKERGLLAFLALATRDDPFTR